MIWDCTVCPHPLHVVHPPPAYGAGEINKTKPNITILNITKPTLTIGGGAEEKINVQILIYRGRAIRESPLRCIMMYGCRGASRSARPIDKPRFGGGGICGKKGKKKAPQRSAWVLFLFTLCVATRTKFSFFHPIRTTPHITCKVPCFFLS